MSATLVIIDMQIAIDDPRYGKRGQLDAEDNIARLLGHWRELGNPVVFVRDNSTDPDSPFAEGTATRQIKPELKPLDHEPVVDKRSANAFVGTDFLQVLEEFGSAELIMCGAHLQHCVETTLRMAASMGFLVFLPEDCVIATEEIDRMGKKWTAEEVHALTLAVLDGNHGKVISSEALLGAGEDHVLQ